VPQIREYYRLSTTVINAYLEPILARYIANLESRLAEVRVTTPQKYIMQSNGGMATFSASAKKAVANRVCRAPQAASPQACRPAARPALRTSSPFDMGGTSCDVALIKEGEPSVQSRGKIEGRDIALPMIDINTVSCGRRHARTRRPLRHSRSRPQSAGAVPGPACYGRGWYEPTITDCNVVLGYLGEDNFPRRQDEARLRRRPPRSWTSTWRRSCPSASKMPPRGSSASST
jgi:N-methylhydantoinase A